MPPPGSAKGPLCWTVGDEKDFMPSQVFPETTVECRPVLALPNHPSLSCVARDASCDSLTVAPALPTAHYVQLLCLGYRASLGLRKHFGQCSARSPLTWALVSVPPLIDLHLSLSLELRFLISLLDAVPGLSAHCCTQQRGAGYLPWKPLAGVGSILNVPQVQHSHRIWEE